MEKRSKNKVTRVEEDQLLHLQQDFRNYLSFKPHHLAKKIIPLDELNIDQTLEIYQNNRMEGLKSSLQDTYETVFKLLGEDIFDQMALSFIREHPSLSHALETYGKDFPAFLKDSNIVQDFPFLYDLALLDDHFRQVLLSLEFQGEDLAGFIAALEEGHNFQLCPNVILIESDHPILGLRKDLLEGLEDSELSGRWGILYKRGDLYLEEVEEDFFQILKNDLSHEKLLEHLQRPSFLDRLKPLIEMRLFQCLK